MQKQKKIIILYSESFPRISQNKLTIIFFVSNVKTEHYKVNIKNEMIPDKWGFMCEHVLSKNITKKNEFIIIEKFIINYNKRLK